MRKLLRPALAIILIFISAYITFTAYMGGVFLAKAENSPPQKGDYAYIPSDDVFLYATREETEGLFLLPPTYYVRLLNYSSTYCQVEYQTDTVHTQRIIGYVKTEKIIFVPYVPQQPYLRHVFDIVYKIDDSAQSNNGFLTQIIMSCAYYGDYKVGSTTYCYVLREGEFGYIPKPYDLIFPENMEYAEYLQSQTESSTAPTANSKTKNNTPAQIAILVTLCLLVPLIAALILKPKPGPDPE